MKIITFLIITILTFPLFSFEAEKEEWVVAFSPFTSKGLSLSNEYLKTVIPTYLEENIERGLNHYLTVEEATELNRVLVKEEIEKLYLERVEKIDARDSKLFNSKELEKDIEGSEIQIKEIDEKIINLESIDIVRLDKIRDIKLNIKKLEDQPKGLEDIKKYIDKNGIDYLITGEIEEVNENLFVRLLLFSRYNGVEYEVFTGIGYSDDILKLRDEMVREINKLIISEDIVSYTVSVEPEDSLIYVNEHFKSIGGYTGTALNDDLLTIEVVKEGYDTRKIQKVVSQDNNLFHIELSAKEEKIVTIRSNPSGVNVYYGSRYLGKTPVDVPVFSVPLKLTLSLEGFVDKNLTITDKIKNQYIHMDSNIIDVDENFKKSKDHFYLALGVFSISLAVPLFLDSMEGQIVTYNNSYSMMQNISLGNAVLWGGYLFYRLYRYLEAAKLSVE